MQATFHPTDPDLVGVACRGSPDKILLYNVSTNNLVMVKSLSTGTSNSIFGLKFSPVNGTRAVGTFDWNSI